MIVMPTLTAYGPDFKVLKRSDVEPVFSGELQTYFDRFVGECQKEGHELFRITLSLEVCCDVSQTREALVAELAGVESHRDSF